MTEERRQKLLQSSQGPGAEPFSQYNHMKVTAVDDGTATVELVLQPDSLNCWGTPHGGALFTMADVAAGMADPAAGGDLHGVLQHRIPVRRPGNREAHRRGHRGEDGRAHGLQPHGHPGRERQARRGPADGDVSDGPPAGAVRAFFRRHRGLHIWLLSVCGVLALYFALRTVPGLMTRFSRGIIMPLERAVAAVCYRASFSVAELLYAIAAGVVLLWLGAAVRRLITEKGRRGRIVYRFVLTVVCTVLTVYAGFSLLWGVNYYAESFQEQSGVYARESTPEELARVTEYFARQLAGCADQVQRDENGLFAESRADIFAHSVRVFDGIYDEFPCLVMEDRVPKGVRFSTALSAMDFTGFYFPFTGEANLNIDSPACYLPSTIAHEMAHQRGIASEQECNFIAIAASTTAQSPAYRYSGWLMGFTYLSNALYRADQEAWKQVRVLLPDTVVADLRDNSAYWAEFEGPVNDAAQKVYDSFLKSSGESRGTQSYGTVVDMLMAYYG